jgi:hypothetical protein
MSKAKNGFDYFTDLEEALRTVSAVSKLLLRMGQDNEADAIMYHFLGSQLRENHERAHDAFTGLHELTRSMRADAP